MIIHFYEKPGCINNTKQKCLLEENGHTVISHSLLTTKWDKDSLRSFFGESPVSDWFNLSAPRIKNGEISPDDFDEDTAIDAMVEEPLLIRRPLIEAEGELACGFDNPLVTRLLAENTKISHLQSCPNLSNSCD
jgi:nitrogenase-associated protein